MALNNTETETKMGCFEALRRVAVWMTKSPSVSSSLLIELAATKDLDGPSRNAILSRLAKEIYDDHHDNAELNRLLDTLCYHPDGDEAQKVKISGIKEVLHFWTMRYRERPKSVRKTLSVHASSQLASVSG